MFMVFSVTHYSKLHNAIIIYENIISYQAKSFLFYNVHLLRQPF